MIKSKNPTMDLRELNKEFSLRIGYTRKDGMTASLWYGWDRAVYFGLDGLDWEVMTPTWEKLYDGGTNTFKYRLYIANGDNLTTEHFRYVFGSPPPPDIHIRPHVYDPAWALGWKYVRNAEKHSVIEIFRVADSEQHVIHTLLASDFGERGSDWLDKRRPIVILKHRTYISICPNLLLAHQYSMARTPEKWSDPWFNPFSYTMSADETAWISDDVFDVVKSWFVPSRSGEAQTIGLGAMLSTLQRLAE